MKPIQITKRQLQLIQLKTMGLLETPQAPATKEDVLAHIRQIGYLQIDTMQAVARAPYHILWSHIGEYKTRWLDELLAETKIFEFWGHALSFLPIELFPVMRGLNLAGERPSRIWEPEVMQFFPHMYDEVLAQIRENGPMCSSDFPARAIPDEFRNRWGGNKPEKIAMQRLWWRMELMVTHRKKFRRYYDLRERVLPDWDDGHAFDADTAHFRLIEQSVKALGVATPKWAREFISLRNHYDETSFAEDAQKGLWIPLQVEDWDFPLYLHPDNLPVLEQAQKGELLPNHTTLLCPFDPLLNDRYRLEAAWNFFYRLESYVPKKKREYGYFVLPILHNGQFIGRMDTKAWRKEKEYEIITLFIEPGVEWTVDMIEAVRQSVWQFARWQKLATVRVSSIQPEGMMGTIKEALESAPNPV
ncbi:MAG: crosslink repair DNA glycosylase YcaQ family protein [Anaerolineae bacterium]|jgi:uncharacterized protein YcaQ|nr:crosslink repair DNA glycosylase YcaQ family protein [Anaerolineae bacterium]